MSLVIGQYFIFMKSNMVLVWVRLSIKRVLMGLTALAVLAICVAACGCALPLGDGGGVPPDKFVFIEHSTVSSGYLIEGNVSYQPYTSPYSGPHICDDFYSYGAEDRSLSVASLDPDNRDDFIAMMGNRYALSGLAGSGTSAVYYFENRTPFEDFGINVTRIEANGTCTVLYRGLNITLKPGESWSNESSVFKEKQNVTDPLTTVKINITTGETITNYGLLNKSDVKEW